MSQSVKESDEEPLLTKGDTLISFFLVVRRTSSNFVENQPMHRKRNFLQIFCYQM